ncbi:MAG: outer membrane protein assembly factor BamD, partial [Candidatus Latescibacterota bacterium]
PRIPNDPEALIDKGDRYYEREKYYGAQELFKAFITRYPGHDRSDYAQFMLAESYYADRDYPMAAVEYQILVTNYGYSDYVDDGYFKQALCSYHQAPKPRLDQTLTYDALAKLEQFEQVFTQSPLIPEARDYKKKIHERLAEKEFENAEFYFKTKRYISSLVYLNKIIDNYPDNEYWVRALYLKAKVFYVRGEKKDESIELLQRVLEQPEEARLEEVKRRARQLLRDVERS